MAPSTVSLEQVFIWWLGSLNSKALKVEPELYKTTPLMPAILELITIELPGNSS